MVDGVEQSQLYDCFALAIKDALEVINQMQADGVISKYAIGGAVGQLVSKRGGGAPVLKNS